MGTGGDIRDFFMAVGIATFLLVSAPAQAQKVPASVPLLRRAHRSITGLLLIAQSGLSDPNE